MQANPNLSIQNIGLLLTIEDLYNYTPNKQEIEEFRNIYSHLNPDIISSTNITGVKFLDIINLDKSEDKIKRKLNNYINIKFNHYDNFKTYDENMIEFEYKSEIISEILNNILKRTKYPTLIQNFLKETPKVKKTKDFYELCQLYKKTNSKRIKFEILRKIGLIILLSRVDRTFLPNTRDTIIDEVKSNLIKGLGLNNKKKEKLHFWINHDNELILTDKLNKHKDKHKISSLARQKKAEKISPIQNKTLTNYVTNKKTKISHIEYRNKFIKGDKIDYTSVMEKIIRKNIEYPNQIRDIYGLKLIVDNKDDVKKLINELENFLGGTSTRKEEKNTINKFDKKQLGKHSSKDYHVWKAIYDITLPHPNLSYIKELMTLLPQNNQAQKLLQEQFNYLNEIPKDYVIEIQIQDLKSYILNICEQSSTNHPILKMNQARTNTFYKLFPRQIYEKELQNLKLKLLNGVE